jgi:hypothetical protein
MDVFIVMSFPKRVIQGVFAEPDAALDLQEYLGGEYKVLQIELAYGQRAPGSFKSRWLTRRDYERSLI